MADWWSEDAPTLGDHWRDGRQPDGNQGDWWKRDIAPVDTTAPAAPTGLTLVAGDSTINLEWDDNAESDLAGYRVCRSETSGSGYADISGLIASSTYDDATAVNGTAYYYVIKAEDSAGNLSVASSESTTTAAASGPSTAPDPNDFDSEIYAAVIDVDTGGTGDYTSLAAAWAGEAANYANNAKKLAFVCRASSAAADTAGLTMSDTAGTTAVEIWCQSTYQFTGYFVNQLHTASLLVDGLRMLSKEDQTRFYNTVGTLLLRNSVINTQEELGAGVCFDIRSDNYVIYNCLAIGGYPYPGNGWLGFNLRGDGGIIDHCTSLECDTSFRFSSSTNITITNCLGDTFVDAFHGTPLSARNNASSDTDAPGTASRTEQTFTYASPGIIANNDTGAKGHGVASGAAWDYGYDIAGNAWSDPPSIGANEPQ